jgi:hypothetical protein
MLNQIKQNLGYHILKNLRNLCNHLRLLQLSNDRLGWSYSLDMGIRNLHTVSGEVELSERNKLDFTFHVIFVT